MNDHGEKTDSNMLNSRVLSEKQLAVVATLRMRLSLKQSLEYMKEAGYPISIATYSRIKRKLKDEQLKRLYHIASIGFESEHLSSIDELELIQKLMWSDYRNCKDSFKRVQILTQIANIRPFLSAYYETTKDVIELNPKLKKKKLLEVAQEDTEQDNNNGN